MRHCVLLTLLFGLTSPSVGWAQSVPKELSLVPADALGVLHVRIAELWQGDAMKEIRTIVQKAGPKALAAFDRRFSPRISTVERMTLFLPARGGFDLRKGPAPIIILATNAPIDQTKFLKGATNQTRAVRNGQSVLHVDERGDMGYSFPDPQTLIIGQPDLLRGYLVGKPATEGRLSKALALAAERPVVLGLNGSIIPAQAVGQLPPTFQPLARTDLITLSMEFPKSTQVTVSMDYANPRLARQAEQSARIALGFAGQALDQAKVELQKMVEGKGGVAGPGSIEELPQAAMALFALGMIETYKESLVNLPLQVKGSALALEVEVPEGPFSTGMTTAGLSVGMLLPAVQKVRQAAARMQDQNNLKQIALAMHNYESAYGRFPSAAICDATGKPLLSWRVAILPYIEQENLYRQFDLTKPWDHPQNKALIARMPQIYLHPQAPKDLEAGKTHYRVFVGKPPALFDLKTGSRLSSITDGTSNTLMCVEAAEPVIWTKPEPLVAEPGKPLPKISTLFPGGFNALFGDGSVRFLPSDLSGATLRALITRSGGEVIDLPRDR